MAQVVPQNRVALQSIEVNENLANYPQTHYGVPKSDADFASQRDSFRERTRGITTSSTVKENQNITIIIPPQQRNLVPDETQFRFKCKINNYQAYTRIGGSIQRIIRSVRIVDGRGKPLEQIYDYNVLFQCLVDVHIDPRAACKILQTEGVYETYKTHDTKGKTLAYHGADLIRSGTTSRITALADSTMQAVQFTNAEGTPQITGLTSTGSTGITKILGEAKDANGNFLKDHPLTRTFFRTNCIPSDTVLVVGDSGAASRCLVPDPGNLDGVFFGSEFTNQPQALTGPTATNINSSDVNNGPIIRSLASIVIFPTLHYSDYYNHVVSKWIVGGEATFVFQLLGSGLMTSTKHLPLNITKGLQFEFTIDTNARSLIHDKEAAHVSTVEEVKKFGSVVIPKEPTNAPSIEITQADVLYTAVTLTPVMQTALESQYLRRGLNYMCPVFHVDRRNVEDATTINIDYYNSFAMLNRIYYFAFDQQKLSSYLYDSFQPIQLNPTRNFLEYNRIYMPHWGNDTDLSNIDHFNESRRGINVLGDRKLCLNTWGEFNSKGRLIDFDNTQMADAGMVTSLHKCKEYFVQTLETEPSAFMTGVDTNNGTIRLRLETANTSQKQIVTIFMALKLITFMDGAPPEVHE